MRRNVSYKPIWEGFYLTLPWLREVSLLKSQLRDENIHTS